MGIITFTSTNVTKAKCGGYACSYIRSDPFNVSFCCFISNDNQKYGLTCLYHFDTSDSFIKKSLFINNSCKIYYDFDYYGVITNEMSRLTVLECIFFKNKAKHAFGAINAVITVINCYGDVLTANIRDHRGTIYTSKMTTSPFNLTLSLLSLGKCEAEFPLSFDLILFGSKKKEILVFEDLFSFNFSLECLFNLTNS